MTTPLPTSPTLSGAPQTPEECGEPVTPEIPTHLGTSVDLQNAPPQDNPDPQEPPQAQDTPEPQDTVEVESPAETAAPQPAEEASSGFAALGLQAPLVRRLSEAGYDSPTPIQEKTIPLLLSARDVIGQAQTGTGKTAAFSLPLIQNLDIERRTVQGLILCPTRELALQVSEALSRYGEPRKVRVLTVYGGAPIFRQLSALRSGVHVVVGTPGRIKDCIARGALSLKSVRHVVLDEADEMLRMGFIEDVEEILSSVPKARQTALFSATMPPEVERIARSALREPVRVEIARRTRTVEQIDQRFLVVRGREKIDVLSRVIEAEPTDAILVFARTRASCAQLVDELSSRGVEAAALHGDLSQEQREEIVRQLRARRIRLVVATDIAARGLHVEGITHVINYDLPIEAEVYVHRIGRTGRAGREGVAISLVTSKDRRLQRSIEHYTGQRMTPMKIPTNAELLAGRRARFQDAVRATMEKGDLDPYYQVIDSMLETPDTDLRQVAAALAKMATLKKPLQIDTQEPKSFSRTPFTKGDGPKDTVRLFVSIGRQAGIRPADLVGAIANEAGVPGRVVGTILIREKVSFVDVAAEHAQTIVERMGRVSLRGRTAAFVLARPQASDRQGNTENKRRKPFGKDNGKTFGDRKRHFPHAKRFNRDDKKRRDR